MSSAFQMPFSNESERGVVSGILQHPMERMDIVVEQVPEGAFYHAANAAAFEVLLDMRQAGRPIDPVTFTNRARELNKLQAIGGETAINELYAHRPPNHHFMAYLRTLQEKRALRLVIETCNRHLEQAYTPGVDPVEVIDMLQKDALLIALDRDERGPRHIAEVLDEIDANTAAAEERLKNNVQLAGWHTGLPRVDHVSQGLEIEDRYVIAGLSNTGKTARLTHMVRAFIEQELRVLIFMLDGSAASTIIRLYAEVADVPVNTIKTGYGLMEHSQEKKQRLKKAKDWLKDKGVFIDDRAGLSIQQINATTRRYKKLHGVQLTAIDFFGNITCPGFAASDRVNMLTAVSKAWKQGVLDAKVPSIMLAQVTAEHVKEGQIPPCSPHIIKDCKSLFEDATKVEALSREFRTLDDLRRDELRIPDTDRQAAVLHEGEQIIVHTMAKSKDGALGHVWTRFAGAVMRFSDLNPSSRLGDSSINKLNRLRKEAPPLQQGTLDAVPAPVAPPKPVFRPTGKSMHGPLKITRPERPPQPGEFMQEPEETQD
jgi:replicative DNA helicase